MSRFLYTVLFTILCTNAIAQPTPIWGFGIGGPANDYSRACRVSANGNVLVTGAFYGTIDLDPSSAVYNITSNGGEDIFLACYSSTGAFLWGFNIGGVNNDGGYNVTTDIFNNVYISGFFQGGADFDPGGGVTILPYAGGLGSTTEGDGFIAKYSSTGAFLWAKDLGGPTVYDYNEALGTDALGDVYVGGVFDVNMTISSTITFSTATAGTAYLIKYDPAGNIVWGHSFGETGAGGLIDCIPRSMQVSNGFIYVCGFFSGTSDFQPWGTSTTLTAVGGGSNDDAFLAKYDTAGNLVFVKQVGGSGTDDELEALVLDSSDNIYLTGFTLSPSVTYDFGSPGTSTITSPGGGGNYDIMMAKYNSAGVYQWGAVFGSSGDDLGRAIDIAGGYLFCSGTFMNTVDFDPSPAVANLVSAGGTDMFLTKYDLNGNYLCGFRAGGTNDDAGYGLSHNSSGDILSSGQFAGTAIDFDPTGGVFPLTSLGGTDAYLVEYNPSCAPVSYTCNTLTMPDSLHLCLGDTATLAAVVTGSDSVISYSWTPATGLSGTTILNPLLTATTSGWYYLTMQSILPPSLVVNGNFSAGNTGFTTGYTLEGYGTVSTPGDYAVDVNPYLYDNAWPVMGDHTTGSGNMLIVDGNPTPGISFWCQVITVLPNTTYLFTVWTALLHDPLPTIQLTINGVNISTFTTSATAAAWQQYQVAWNSGTSTVANICMTDLVTGGFGNDFAVDDIYLQQLCTITDSMYVLAGHDTTHTHTDTSLCVGNNITLNAPSGYPSHTWNTGATTSSIVVSAGGTYWVIATGSCLLLSDTFNVTANAPVLTSQKTDTAFCNGGSVMLTAPAGYTTPAWSTGATTPSVTINTAGTYWVTYTNTSACTILSDTFNVIAKPQPQVDLGSDTTICPGDSLLLSGPEISGTYLWSTGSTTQTITVYTTGTYVLTVSENGCIASDTIKISQETIPVLNLGPDTVLCKGDTYILTATVPLLWSNGKTGISISVTDSAIYWGSFTNNCGTIKDSVMVAFVPCDLYFPSAFTPNGDGRNDIARVVGDLGRYKEFSLSIYNRWGQRVYYTTDIYAGWDGIFEGVKQDLGVFFYMIFYTLEGKQHMMKGDLTLIR